ncbi:pimeloyl-ACP methyl ester carboxylesterase [Fontibacillus phaseoli]|uniref:Pimeloyl-ACP methyl ester carboxylesterase n=1 Tax=Fontibacillus phaseoli TaxID=1416533 RepID=A0A369BJB9_9BACL|nr:alpha/beta hydrolase [Fontibacillus phaseoli]RCX21491.1 pimeloyl-ACP methyl ester carboxylesterase [Fontibacillus phaseoli]
MKLSYKESGNPEASLIVFLHGGGVSGWMWEKQVEYFHDYHCLVPDLPGHGLSPSPDFTIKDSAEDIFGLIQTKAQGKKVILIGFSLGAQVAIKLLSMKPEIADYSIINSALVRPIPWANKIIKPMVRLTYRLTKNRTFSKLQAKQLYIGAPYFETYYKETCNMDFNTLIKILEENMSFSIPAEFRMSKSKILITVGDKEKKIMKKSALDILGKTSNGKAVFIPKMGHGVSLAEPEFFNKMVDAWINDKELPSRLTLKGVE